MPDKVADFLRMVPTSDRVRAAAWDAVYEATDDADREQRMKALPLDDRVKARIWDLAHEAPEQPAAPPQGPEGSALSRFVSNAASALDPRPIVKAGFNALYNPLANIPMANALVDAQLAEAQKAKEAAAQGHDWEAAGHTYASILPVIGPAAAHAGEQIASGDWAGGAGSATPLLAGAGLARPMMRGAGRLAQEMGTEALGRRLYQSALKPTKATLNDVRPAAGLTRQETLLQTGLDERVPVTAGGVRKAENLIDSLNAEVQSRVAKIQASGEKVDPKLVEQAIDDVARDFTNQVNAQPDLAAIDTVRQNFRNNPNVAKQTAPAIPSNFARGIKGSPAQMQAGPIEPDVAQQMKTNTYKGLRGKFGQERGATIEAEKAGARGLRQGIEEAGQRAGVTDIADLNAREGSLISLEHALVDAMRRRGNYDVLGLKPAIGVTTALASESTLPLLATLVDRFPGLVSRTGIWINRVGKRSGNLTQAATRPALVTSPSESRNRTRARGSLVPEEAR